MTTVKVLKSELPQHGEKAYFSKDGARIWGMPADSSIGDMIQSGARWALYNSGMIVDLYRVRDGARAVVGTMGIGAKDERYVLVYFEVVDEKGGN